MKVATVCLLLCLALVASARAEVGDLLVEDNTPGHWMTSLLGGEGENDQLTATRGKAASKVDDASFSASVASAHSEDEGNDADEESQEQSDKQEMEREASRDHEEEEDDDDDDDDADSEHSDDDDDNDEEEAGDHIPDTFLEEDEDENGHTVDEAITTSAEDEEDDEALNGSEQDDEMNGVAAPATEGDEDAAEVNLATGAQTEAEASTSAKWQMSARQKRLLAKAKQKARLAKQKAKNQRFRSLMSNAVQSYARRAVRKQIKWFIDNYLDKDAVALARPFHKREIPHHKLDVEPGPGPNDPEPWNTAQRKPDSPGTVDGGIKNPGTIREVNPEAHVAEFPPKTQ